MIKNFLRIVFIGGLLFLLGWLIYETTTVITYILVAIILALIGRPLFNALDRLTIRGRHLSNGIKAAITLLVIFGLIGGLIGAFLPMILTEAQLLTKIDLEQIKSALSPSLDRFNQAVRRFSPGNSQEYSESEVIQYLFESLDLRAVPQVLNSLVGTAGNLLIAIFSVAFISFFFLKDKNLMTDVILKVTPHSKEVSIRRILVNTRRTLSRYFLGLLLQVIAITLCIFIGLSIVGVKNALLIAFFTGIVNLVPYLGPWIGASFGVFILVANNLDASFAEVIQPKLLGLVVVFGTTQLIDNYVFQPAIFSNSINAHPLEIFIVILVAGSLGGVAGMIAAIPVYSFLRIVFNEMDRELHWLERLKSR
jgi:predicted PurR-regulated permease PerM